VTVIGRLERCRRPHLEEENAAMMKGLILGTTVLLVAAGSAVAAPRHQGDRWSDGRGSITPWERVQIAQSAARVAMVKRQAYRDGRISMFERFEIRRAEARHEALVRRLRRS
jgi:hypothetical protein